MTERMTPSEIAEVLHCYAVEAEGNDCPEIAGDLDKAAATIRELEVSNKARADIIYAQTKASEIDREKLKIATEALETIEAQTMSMHVSIDALARHGIRTATQALARIYAAE